MSDGLGIWLRRARETRQITLEDAEKALRIRRRYLQALEMGDYTALPGEIQARGFLRNYARYLNLPVEEALARYDAEIQGRPMQPRMRPGPVEPKPPIVDRPTVFSPPPTEAEEARASGAHVPGVLFQVLIIALIFSLVVAAGAFIWLQIASRDASSAVTPSATVAETTAPIIQGTPTVPAAFPASADGKISTRLVTEENAWISVSADANLVFQGIAAPGQVIEATANEMLLVATGNGGAFHLYINGTDWGPLGKTGEIVRRAWTPFGEVPLEQP
ncbi:MAG TPA: DUF4115 domain-containing protein [Anaerolineae bacterium]|nr:DUF4115 domain-containing protein [Anaerolineae bacterium]HQK13756.1 DUF4115 domain-containing protein [Anaerolineae bacterium]